MPGIWQNATIFSLPARGIPVEISAVRLLYHIFERMWSHFWTEPRPARLHLFAADIVPVDRTTRERAASGSQNGAQRLAARSEEHTSELQSLLRISYAVFCLKKKKNKLIRLNLRI